jgi:hypothetical protein
LSGPAELGVSTHAIAVAADIDQVAVMQNPIDERGSHDVITEDFAPFLEGLVRREHS